MLDKILCVDDEPNVLDAYQRGLRKEFQIDVAVSGALGLEMMKSEGPYAVVVSDMRMPEMDGVRFLAQARKLAPETIRIMLTGNADQHTATEAVNQGHIFRFLNKPCSPESFKSSLVAGVQQYHTKRAEKELLEKTLIGSLQLVTDILSMVNPTAFGRGSRVRRLVRQLSAVMKPEDAWQIEIAAMLSQIGAITVPEDVLTRVYEGKLLTPEERTMMENSPRVGHDLISRIPRMEPVANIIAHQERLAHEPNEANEPNQPLVPLGAHILNLALDFDKLIESRLSSSLALIEIQKWAHRYDPLALAALSEVVAASETLYELREVKIGDLEDHTILADNITAASGVLIVAKGQEITQSLRLRLVNFLLRGSIRSSVRVFVPIETPVYRRESEALPIIATTQV